jgi:NADPH:quinone reductase-like Zn-dependent oxidoreductase
VTTTSSEKNLDLVRSLGADEALDYTKTTGLGAGRNWSCVFDVFGNRRFSAAKASLAPHGVYVTTVPSVRNVFDDLRTRWLPFKKARLVVVKSNAKDLEVLRGFVERGLLRPIIDRVVPLAETAAGQTHVETKRARGKVVISVSTA